MQPGLCGMTWDPQGTWVCLGQGGCDGSLQVLTLHYYEIQIC